MSNLNDLDRVRAITATVMERARADEAFRNELQADPARVLREAGLPDNTAGQIAYDEWQLEDVVGFMGPEGEGPQPICHFTCDIFSCWSTRCANVPRGTMA